MSDYLQHQRELLTAALATFPEGPLRVRLMAEGQNLAAAAPRDVTDRAFELALVAQLSPLRLPDGPATLLADLAAHPALIVLGRAPALTPAAATAIVHVVQEVHRGPLQVSRLGLGHVPALRTAAGDAAAFNEMAGILFARWLAVPAVQRPYLERDVAVMLPVRLETLFKPTAATWEMWLRIVPDEASIRRNDPIPKPVEVRFLQEMWRSIQAALTDAERALPFDEWIDSAPGRIEWDTFCGRVGPGRAAWLVAACLPVLLDGVVSVDVAKVGNEALPNRVGGFPPRLEVWAAFGKDAPIRIDSIDVALEALVFDVIGARPVGPDTTDLVHEKDRWWVSWPAAKEVGLGRIIELPAGRAPADIRTLYVVGLGDDNPAEHFRAQIDAGEMATLPLGAATNAVDGAQAAELGHSTAAWRLVAQQRMRSSGAPLHLPSENELSRSLTGVGDGLPAMPVADSIPGLDLALVKALWPALWGHQLRDLWGCVEEADRLASWVQRYVRPEGPLPPIRIEEQPYGLLPTSALSLWTVADEEGPLAPLEERLRPGLLAMRSYWAAVARQHGNAVGADTQRLMDLIARDAVSASYCYRTFFATELWGALYAGSTGLSQATFDKWVQTTFAPVYELVRRGPNDPPGFRHHLAGGDYRRLAIPLVVPRHWPVTYYEKDGQNLDENGNPMLQSSVERSFAGLLKTLVDVGYRHDLVFQQWRGLLPDSLLIRLLLHAGVLSAAAVAQVNTGVPAPLREPLIGDSSTVTLLDQLTVGYSPDMPHRSPAGQVRQGVNSGLEMLLKMIEEQPPEAHAMAQLERAFRATLDTATHRIDPWIIGMATRRLEFLRNQPEARFRLAVYGWVDGPIQGAPGPTEAGLIHAPSHAQALTGAILRDKQISERQEVPPPPDGRDLWSIQLESQRLRLAEELADEVRVGSHVFEALGRRVEQVVGVRTPIGPVVEGTSRVDVLRTAYPAKEGQPDRGRVCHGANALAALLGGGPLPLEITADQRTELELLQQVLDAYGDLLVAEAVHQVVSGHADRAGAAMDAAAGLGKPPSFGFSETPLSGDGMTTSALAVVPYVPSPASPDAAISPARLADASVAVALKQLVGVDSTWTWQGAGTDGVLRTATLADLGLEPVDTLVVSPDLLASLARAWLDVGEDVALGGSGPRLHSLARDIARALGSQPALLRDVAPLSASAEEVEQQRAIDASLLEELRTRYSLVRDCAQLVIDELAAARAAGDPALLRQALFRALRWGVNPLAAGDELRELYALLVRNVLPKRASLLTSLAKNAEDSLHERLAAAPPLATTEPLGRAIAELAAPGGQLAILSRMSAATLAQASGLRIDAPDRNLDIEWLTVVAAVRPRLAAVEALQLEALPAANGLPTRFVGFTAWSSAPEDPWGTAALAILRQRRLQPGGNDPRLVLPRFVAAYTSGDVWHDAAGDPDPILAVGLIDSWSEAVPRSQQTTTAAFGFNAPGARPPQAILLAVPPDLTTGFGVRLETGMLIQILEETRELAHARAVDAEQLGTYLVAVPTTMFGATGPTGVRLDRATTFPR